MNRFATVGALLVLTASADAQQIFRDGFETPCSELDLDNDRLSGCQEVALLTDPTDQDTDDDGLRDGDEVWGTVDGLNLPGMGVDPRRKDLLIEYDWQNDNVEPGTCSFHTHKPDVESVDELKAVFAAAPVLNPDGSTGINLIQDYGQGGAFTGGNFIDVANATIQGAVDEPDFQNNYKPANFAQNRQGYFHYAIHTHAYTAIPGSLGQAELYGDDIIVSTGCTWNQGVIRRITMHELGHNLGLHHGGDSPCNRKPNYNSVMNYKWLDGIDTDCDKESDDVVNYSIGVRAVLDENHLDETIGICGGKAIDWNGDGVLKTDLAKDINAYGNSIQQVNECGGILTSLTDHDDWAAITLLGLPPGSGEPAAQISSCEPLSIQ